MVLVVKDQFIPGGSRKLEPKFKGPWIITEILGNDRYRIGTIPGTEGKQYSTVYSADRIKKWCALELLDELQDPENEEDED